MNCAVHFINTICDLSTINRSLSNNSIALSKSMIYSSLQLFLFFNFGNSKAAAANCWLYKHWKTNLSYDISCRVRNILSDINILCHLYAGIIQKSLARMFIKCNCRNKGGASGERNVHHLQISLKQTIFPRRTMYHYECLVKLNKSVSAKYGEVRFVYLFAACLHIAEASPHYQIQIYFLSVGRENKQPACTS